LVGIILNRLSSQNGRAYYGEGYGYGYGYGGYGGCDAEGGELGEEMVTVEGESTPPDGESRPWGPPDDRKRAA
jgi:hypothetical protein